jgi:hypothetical protein
VKKALESRTHEDVPDCVDDCVDVDALAIVTELAVPVEEEASRGLSLRISCLVKSSCEEEA